MNSMFAVVVAVLAVSLIHQGSFAETQRVVSEDRLNQCYEAHPFFLESLMLISDKDFANSNLSLQRKNQLQAAFKKKPSEIRQCLADILQFAKNQGDAENSKYVAKRMSEISSIVNPASRRPEPPVDEAVR